MNWTLYFFILFMCIFLPLYEIHRRRRRYIRKLVRMRRGGFKMSTKLLSEFIGKQVTIFMEGGVAGYVATLLEVDENFIKVEDKKTIKVLNTDMISQIYVRKDKQ